MRYAIFSLHMGIGNITQDCAGGATSTNRKETDATLFYLFVTQIICKKLTNNCLKHSMYMLLYGLRFVLVLLLAAEHFSITSY